MDNILEAFKSTSDPYQAIGVSASHLTADDALLLEDMAEDQENNKVAGRETGWFIKLEETGSHGHSMFQSMSDQFKLILEVAINSGYRLVELDLDGEEFDQLEVYI